MNGDDVRRPNPFRAGFGAQPPVLVGRDVVLRSFSDAILDGPGTQARAKTITGPRGIGKTVLLNELRKVPALNGWVAVGVSAGPRMLDDILDGVLAATDHLTSASNPKRSTITGVSLSAMGVASLGVTRQPTAEHEFGWRSKMEALLNLLAEHESGLTITVDEVTTSESENLKYLAQTYQHWVGDGREVAIAFAGLPEEVAAMETAPGLTFIWRAVSEHLGPVPLTDVRAAFTDTIEAAGRSADRDAVKAMAEATQGYPFLIQLVGQCVWRQSDDEERSLGLTSTQASTKHSPYSVETCTHLRCAASSRRTGPSLTQWQPPTAHPP